LGISWSPALFFVSLGMEMNNNKDWKKMGFKNEKEYNDFLDQKAKALLDKIKNDPKLLNVFKRLNDK